LSPGPILFAPVVASDALLARRPASPAARGAVGTASRRAPRHATPRHGAAGHRVRFRCNPLPCAESCTVLFATSRTSNFRVRGGLLSTSLPWRGPAPPGKESFPEARAGRGEPGVRPVDLQLGPQEKRRRGSTPAVRLRGVLAEEHRIQGGQARAGVRTGRNSALASPRERKILNSLPGTRGSATALCAAPPSP
ncbi:unnamed protein product, partial [Prorocentrum cordatum]